MKVVEDYTATPTLETTPATTRLPPSMVRANPVAQAHDAQSATRVGKPPRERPPPVVQAVFSPESRAAALVPERSEVPMPPPTSDDVPAVGEPRRGRTTQLRLRAFENRRMMAMAIAGGLAIVGVLAFLTAAWQLNDADTLPPPPSPEAQAPVDPKATALSGPLKDYLERQQQQQGATAPRPKAHTEPSERDEASVAAPKDSAFLTLRANVPARVFIDGERVNRRLPLVRFPVKPGTRTIEVEATGTSERRQFSLRFNKGQHRVMEETFTAEPGR
jgi:serine/threonine-protein kinase